MPAPITTTTSDLGESLHSVIVELPSHYLRLDMAGRLIFDECPTDAEHLVHNPSTEEGQPTCRYSLTNLVPAHMFQRKGRWKVSFTLEPE